MNINPSLHSLQRQLHSYHYSFYHRIHSIYNDWLWLKEYIELYRYIQSRKRDNNDDGNDESNHLLIYANKSCGEWYIDPSCNQSKTCYFKSTDGHLHQWDFSMTRLNLHILVDIIHQYHHHTYTHTHKCSHTTGDTEIRHDTPTPSTMIVDSTRDGKVLPDSFSKTIPIWCCVINNVIHEHRIHCQKCMVKRRRSTHYNNDDNDDEYMMMDTQLLLPLSIVSIKEYRDIMKLIPQWVEKFMNLIQARQHHDSDHHHILNVCELSDYMYHHGLRGFRCQWIIRAHHNTIRYIDNDHHHSHYHTFLLINPSEQHYNNSISRTYHYYIVGAADDANNWNLGITPSLYWSIYDILMMLPNDRELLMGIVKDIVQYYTYHGRDVHQTREYLLHKYHDLIEYYRKDNHDDDKQMNRNDCSTEEFCGFTFVSTSDQDKDVNGNDSDIHDDTHQNEEQSKCNDFSNMDGSTVTNKAEIGGIDKSKKRSNMHRIGNTMIYIHLTDSANAVQVIEDGHNTASVTLLMGTKQHRIPAAALADVVQLKEKENEQQTVSTVEDKNNIDEMCNRWKHRHVKIHVPYEPKAHRALLYILPQVMAHAAIWLPQEGPERYIVEGTDIILCHAIVTALLLQHYDSNYKLNSFTSNLCKLDKRRIRSTYTYAESFACIPTYPPRALFQQLNRYFLSNSHYQ